MQIVHNKINGLFEIVLEGHKAELQYRIRENTIFFMHTWVPQQIEGRGLASALARFGLEFARENGYQIAVYCSFMVLFIKKNKEYLSMLNHKYQKPERFN